MTGLSRLTWVLVPIILLTSSCMYHPFSARSANTQDVLTFHRDPGRTGWDASEVELTPAKVASGAFGRLWASPQLDPINGVPPRLYASPLYVDRVSIDYSNAPRLFSVVIAATSTGFVYAVNAFDSAGAPAGTLLWRTQLGAPCEDGFDGVTTGILSTPVIDSHSKRLYVANCEGKYVWRIYALDLTNGKVAPDWPVEIDRSALVANNTNVGTFDGAGKGARSTPRNELLRAQRGALTLSKDGSELYVTFGESTPGWLASIDTRRAKLSSAFASTASMATRVGGVWAPGGVALDGRGELFVVSGAAFNGLALEPQNWAQSVLEFSSAEGRLRLVGTYTPFDYCETTNADVDLGSGGVILVPDLDPSSTSTPRLLAVGGKQGNVYLLDRTRLPGRLDQRPACSSDSSSDASLLPPDSQPQFGKRGPLNVFGPYTETAAAMEQARSRSIPAYFHAQDGAHYLFVSGTTRPSEDSETAVPPGLVRLRVAVDPGRPAYLRIDQRQMSAVLQNPGSPVVTSNGSRNAVVWVLDENAPRFSRLGATTNVRPVLYAFDAITLKLLWRSAEGELEAGGKYNEPAIARGTVFVGTDRIVAFGMRRGR
jgi:hypothetical protein